MVRGRFLQGLVELHDQGELTLPGDPDSVAGDRAAKNIASTIAQANRRKHWIVHVEAPKGRGVDQVAKYLASYVKRIAISDHRLRKVTDTQVTFGSRRGPVTLDGVEFVRRFLLHVLPQRLRKVRDYGLYAPANAKLRLPRARSLIAAKASATQPTPEDPPETKREACPSCKQGHILHIYPDPPVRRVLSLHDILTLLAERPRGPP